MPAVGSLDCILACQSSPRPSNSCQTPAAAETEGQGAPAPGRQYRRCRWPSWPRPDPRSSSIAPQLGPHPRGCGPPCRQGACVRIVLPRLQLLRSIACTSRTLHCLHMPPPLPLPGVPLSDMAHVSECTPAHGARVTSDETCQKTMHQCIPQSARLLHTRAATARQDSGSVHYGKDSAPLRQRLWQCGTRAQRSKKQSLAARPEENMFYIEHVYHPSDRAPSAHDNSMPRVHPRGRC